MSPSDARLSRKNCAASISFTLAPVDTGERATPLRVFFCKKDFDEYYCIAVEHDQIRARRAGMPVSAPARRRPCCCSRCCKAFGSASSGFCALDRSGISVGIRQALDLAADELRPWHLAVNALVGAHAQAAERPSMRVSGNALSWPRRGARR